MINLNEFLQKHSYNLTLKDGIDRDIFLKSIPKEKQQDYFRIVYTCKSKTNIKFFDIEKLPVIKSEDELFNFVISITGPGVSYFDFSVWDNKRNSFNHVYVWEEQSEVEYDDDYNDDFYTELRTDFIDNKLKEKIRIKG